MRRFGSSWLCFALALLVATLSSACAKRPAKVPGETDIDVSSVEIEILPLEKDDELLETSELLPRLGMRAGSFTAPDRYFSDFRVAEDRRRIAAFFQTFGYFDVVVDEPKLDFEKGEEGEKVAIAWKVHPGARYKIGSVQVKHAIGEPETKPLLTREEIDGKIADMIPFEAGEEEPDLEAYRKVRNDMGDWLRRKGFAHANVYSRAFVDRQKKVIHWYYWIDAGPATKVGKIEVDGEKKVPEHLVLERVGMEPGDPFNIDDKEDAEFDLLDTGAYNSTFIRSNADVKFIVPGTTPDTGGDLRDEQVDEHGNLIARELPDNLDITVHVVEAPSFHVRARASLEFDPNRVDTALGSRVFMRNLMGPLHHLVLEGRIGYGILWRGDTDQPTGLYGEALARTLHPGTIGRLGDVRTTTRFRDDLYPGYHGREFTTGPGIRATLDRGLFWDTDIFFRWGQEVDFGPFSDRVREKNELADDPISIGPELETGLIWDRRDNPVEPMSGHLLALRFELGPGEPIGTHRYLDVLPQATYLQPLTKSLSVGVHASGGWALLGSDQGMPLGARLFGGGAYGMRAYGYQFLSPTAASCENPPPEGREYPCTEVPIGGLSLFEAAFEVRFLPLQKPYGAVVFFDAGGAGRGYDPFEDGPSFAAGLGVRLRVWYLPIAVDGSYAIMRRGRVGPPDQPETYSVFMRVGEAF